MCELYASNASSPCDVSAHLRSFYSHSTSHPHGWGLALRGEGIAFTGECERDVWPADSFTHTDDIYMIKGAHCAAESQELMRCLEGPIAAQRIYGHIRFASCGQRSIHNAHPFIKRFDSHTVLVMHNGVLFDTTLVDKYFTHRLGETDSELIALHVAHLLETQPLEKRGRAMADFLALLSRGNVDCNHTIPASLLSLARSKGRAINKVNLICDDGTYTYAHTNTCDPTLFVFEENDHVSLSTTPLDNSNWKELERGRVYMWNNGKRVWVSDAHDFLFEETEETSREALCCIHD